jgi:isoleucyl-tRNA synthetase
MIENRPDWCLSRQRIWGVPIPVFNCKSCGNVLADADVMDRVADAIEKEGGIEAYHAHPERDFVGDRICSKCGGKEFSRGQDILDVWFDSGVCWSAVQKRRSGMSFPADVYLEGSDQHRGWFQTSLLASMASTGEPPFKALVTHGFVTDVQGRKMSKSLGNVVDPAEIIKKSGAEILRLWAAYEDFGQDMGCGKESFDRVTETYRRFRNTMRFMLGNLHDFDPTQDQVKFAEMSVLDRWALGRLNDLVRETRSAFEAYDFYKVYHALNLFFTVTLSAGYLDMLKDRLYTFKATSRERRSAQTAIFTITEHLVRIMAPITSFLADEVYGHLPGPKEDSVFLCDFPQTRSEWDQAEIAQDLSGLFEVRGEVLKELETLRQSKVIGSGLDARVTLSADETRLQLLRKYEPLLSEFFIVSQVQLASGAAKIAVEHAAGQKCERCWYFSEDIGQDQKHPTVCGKCSRALA